MLPLGPGSSVNEFDIIKQPIINKNDRQTAIVFIMFFFIFSPPYILYHIFLILYLLFIPNIFKLILLRCLDIFHIP